VVGVDPIASLLLPPPTGRMRNVSQQVKQQAAGKSNSRLPQVRARGQAACERERGKITLRLRLRVIIIRNTGQLAALFSSFLFLLEPPWHKLLDTEVGEAAGDGGELEGIGRGAGAGAEARDGVGSAGCVFGAVRSFARRSSTYYNA